MLCFADFFWPSIFRAVLCFADDFFFFWPSIFCAVLCFADEFFFGRQYIAPCYVLPTNNFYNFLFFFGRQYFELCNVVPPNFFWQVIHGVDL